MLIAVLCIVAGFTPLPQYTDAEAVAFAKRVEELTADATAGKRQPPTTFEAALKELKIDPRKLRGYTLLVGNATDWAEYRLSPNYKLTAAFTQMPPKESVFRDLNITEVKR